MPATNAVDILEKEVGWNASNSNFVDGEPLKPLKDGINGELLSENFPQLQLVDTGNRPLFDVVDIVIPSIRDLDFLEVWKPFIEKFHLIIVQDGDPKKHLKIPKWANYELYNRDDIELALTSRSWIISKKDASIRNFGFLVSDKKIVYTLDDGCLPATDHDGNLVNSIESHVYNLLTPSTPYFFNTGNHTSYSSQSS